MPINTKIPQKLQDMQRVNLFHLYINKMRRKILMHFSPGSADLFSGLFFLNTADIVRIHSVGIVMPFVLTAISILMIVREIYHSCINRFPIIRILLDLWSFPNNKTALDCKIIAPG